MRCFPISREGTPVIFELKRNRDRLQLLQAISYAAMVAKWDAARFQQALGAKSDNDAQELRSLLNDDAFQLGAPEIVLIAESFGSSGSLRDDFLVRLPWALTSAVTGEWLPRSCHAGRTIVSPSVGWQIASCA